MAPGGNLPVAFQHLFVEIDELGALLKVGQSVPSRGDQWRIDREQAVSPAIRIEQQLVRAHGDRLTFELERRLPLRYGENPHQSAALFAPVGLRGSVLKHAQLCGASRRGRGRQSVRLGTISTVQFSCLASVLQRGPARKMTSNQMTPHLITFHIMTFQLITFHPMTFLLMRFHLMHNTE